MVKQLSSFVVCKKFSGRCIIFYRTDCYLHVNIYNLSQGDNNIIVCRNTVMSTSELSYKKLIKIKNCQSKTLMACATSVKMACDNKSFNKDNNKFFV